METILLEVTIIPNQLTGAKAMIGFTEEIVMTPIYLMRVTVTMLFMIQAELIL